jgi:hypothetical protein
MFPSRDVADGPLCAQHDPEMWFDSERYAEAKTLCQRCPVQAACLDAALTVGRIEDQRYGVWGGFIPSERATLRRRR